jgi:hypothetical protein
VDSHGSKHFLAENLAYYGLYGKYGVWQRLIQAPGNFRSWETRIYSLLKTHLASVTVSPETKKPEKGWRSTVLNIRDLLDV